MQDVTSGLVEKLIPEASPRTCRCGVRYLARISLLVSLAILIQSRLINYSSVRRHLAEVQTAITLVSPVVGSTRAQQLAQSARKPHSIQLGKPLQITQPFGDGFVVPKDAVNVISANTAGSTAIASDDVRAATAPLGRTTGRKMKALSTNKFLTQAVPSASELLAPRKRQTREFYKHLNQMSNLASILCALDCTVFPLLLTVLPFITAVSSGGLTSWLHQASHALALGFVGPVGGFAVTANWLQHGQGLVGLWGYSGIALILLSNLPHSMVEARVPEAISHSWHENHQVLNVLGCMLLLSSQRYAHTLVQACSCSECVYGDEQRSQRSQQPRIMLRKRPQRLSQHNITQSVF